MHDYAISRRNFIKSLGYIIGAGVCCRSGSAALEPGPAVNASNINRLAKIIDTLPREKIIEVIVSEIKLGLTYNELITALTQVAVHTLQPYPDVGFKYHGVMMMQSLYLTSQALPVDENWLPLLWGIDEPKRQMQHSPGRHC